MMFYMRVLCECKHEGPMNVSTKIMKSQALKPNECEHKSDLKPSMKTFLKSGVKIFTKSGIKA